LEPHVRQCLRELQQQQKIQHEKGKGPLLQVTCMSTSILSPATHWTLVCGPHWQADVVLQGGPRLSVTWWYHQEQKQQQQQQKTIESSRGTTTNTDEDYHRKVDFVTLGPFSMFLQQQLGRLSL
jgi:hypothetical protein